jgi:hypothetical protein
MGEDFGGMEIPEIDEELVIWRQQIELALRSGLSEADLSRMKTLARRMSEDRWNKMFQEAATQVRKEFSSEE